MMICYFEPNFVEICLREKWFFNFPSGRKISKMTAVLKWCIFFIFFFTDDHNLMYSINGAIFIRKLHWEIGFLKGVHRNPLRHQIVIPPNSGKYLSHCVNWPLLADAGGKERFCLAFSIKITVCRPHRLEMVN